MLVALSCCCSSRVSQSFVERRTIVCRTPHDCLSNAARLFVERRTIVCRTSADGIVIDSRGGPCGRPPLLK